MRIRDSFICFILSNGSHDVYHAAMLLWIYKGHPKLCGGLPSDVFSYMGLFENPTNDWMIYFMLRLWAQDKTEVWGNPGKLPSLCVCYMGQSVAHRLHLCQHRNDVSVFLTDATHVGCKPPRGRRPGERSRASCTWKGSAAGGKRRVKTQKWELNGERVRPVRQSAFMFVLTLTYSFK